MPIILLMIGLVLIIYNYHNIKKEERIKQEESGNLSISFQSLLQDNKEELSDYKMEIGILRKDIAESLTELQEEIVEIKNNLNVLKNDNKVYENKEDLEKNYIDKNDLDTDVLNDTDIDDEVISETTFSESVDSDKTQKIKKLLNEGLTVEEICYELSVSKGEVLLVKGLYKK